MRQELNDLRMEENSDSDPCMYEDRHANNLATNTVPNKHPSIGYGMGGGHDK